MILFSFCLYIYSGNKLIICYLPAIKLLDDLLIRNPISKYFGKNDANPTTINISEHIQKQAIM